MPGATESAEWSGQDLPTQLAFACTIVIWAKCPRRLGAAGGEMGTFSVWHWLIVILFVGVPIWLLVRYFRQRRTAQPSTQPIAGIGGWLALLGFGLCVGLLRSIVELIVGWSDYISGFQNPAAYVPLVAMGLATLALVIVQLWTIVAFFQKQRAFKTAFLILWAMFVLVPLVTLLLLTVPGVQFEMIWPGGEFGRTIGASIGMGLWYWYVCVSERVKNTFVN